MTGDLFPFVHADGGRAAAGFKGTTDDCGVRAVALAADRPYQTVYDELFDAQRRYADEHNDKYARAIRKRGASPRLGVFKPVFNQYVWALGFEWQPTMFPGQGCTVHVRPSELPDTTRGGALILSLSRHYTVVLDGRVHDTHDPSRGGTRCVYGWWWNAGTEEDR